MSKLDFKGRLDYKDKSVSVNLGMYLFKEGESYIVYCPALDLSAYGDSEEHAKESMSGVFEMTIKYMLDENTMETDLKNHGWQIRSLKQRKVIAPSLAVMLKSNESFREILENREYTAYKQLFGIPRFA